MTRKEELRIVIREVRQDIAHAGGMIPKASSPDSDFFLHELKKSLGDLDKYIAEYKELQS